ncbi:MAG: flavodoxin family protein [Candidatus Electrothrix sp.]
MSNQLAVILDGSRPDDVQIKPILTLLSEALFQCGATKVKTFTLRDLCINPCIGCFNCWFKTPGQCVHRGDRGAEILQTILNSKTIILFTPVIFGGYSSELKKMVDRLLPLVIPFLIKAHGETHHPLRYSTFPHIVGIGVHPHPNKELSECFQTLVGRNALHFHLPHFSAEVFTNSNFSPNELRDKFHALLSRTDKPPLQKRLNSLLQKNKPSLKKFTKSHRALLITGSPKKNNNSTSAILGSCQAKHLDKHNITTESLTLKESLLFQKEQHNLCVAIDRADTIILASPLYFDSLPFLVTKAFEIISEYRKGQVAREPKIFLAIINNGLPESYQNTVAFAICRNFALETGMLWAGGLSMGAGEALISGNSLIGYKGFRGYTRPPLFYISKSLKMTAAALAKGYPVPEKAAQLIEKIPIPFISPERWSAYIIRIAEKMFKKEVVKNGLRTEEIFNKPYEK